MSFLDTEPAAIQRFDTAGPWARFRVSDPRIMVATLREICRSDVPLTLGAAGGAAFAAALWAVDPEKQRIHFKVTRAVADLDERLAAPDLWAAGYLQDAKVQFDLRGLTVEARDGVCMLHAALPRFMVHLPRRRSVRVRRAETDTPSVRFRHPSDDNALVRLRVVDISMSGVALARPAGSLPLAPGNELRAVEVELDPQSIFYADLRVQHVSAVSTARARVRVGCAWHGLGGSAADTLQRWIARGRRRRDLVSLSFD